MRHRRSSRIWVSLFVALRVLVVLLGLQVSGVVHAVEDGVSLAMAGHAEHEEQCPADGPCDDCPPGCPQCHCPNAMRSLAPKAGAPFVLVAEAASAAALDAAMRAPLSPDLPGLFRPPQADLTLS
jgi:hypothetical protein